MNAAKVALAIGAFFALPAVVAGGGFAVASTLTFLAFVAIFGGRFGLRILEKREIGAKAGRQSARHSPDNSEWNRR